MEKTKTRKESIDKWRIVLMLVGGISYMGFPSQYDIIIRILCSFAAPTFYMLSGYLVMRKSKNRPERILHAIKKTAIVFGVLAVCYFLLSCIVNFKETISAVTSLSFWFDFIVLNIFSLPVGGHLWYIQALLYGYIILYFAEKFNLLKYDWLIITVCFVIAFLTGDIASLIGFKFAGHEYLMGNFITRAIPYILLGRYIHKVRHDKIKLSCALIFFFGGIALIFAELAILQAVGVLEYYGHLIGHIFMALGASLFICTKKKGKFHSEWMKKFSTYGTNWIYYLAQPIFVILNATFFNSESVFDSGYSTLVALSGSMVIVMLAYMIVKMKSLNKLKHKFKRKVKRKIKQKNTYKNNHKNKHTLKHKIKHRIHKLKHKIHKAKRKHKYKTEIKR